MKIKIRREKRGKKVRGGVLAMGDSRGPERGRVFWAEMAYSYKI
jgi:hypothetical protein